MIIEKGAYKTRSCNSYCFEINIKNCSFITNAKKLKNTLF